MEGDRVGHVGLESSGASAGRELHCSGAIQLVMCLTCRLVPSLFGPGQNVSLYENSRTGAQTVLSLAAYSIYLAMGFLMFSVMKDSITAEPRFQTSTSTLAGVILNPFRGCVSVANVLTVVHGISTNVHLAPFPSASVRLACIECTVCS